MEGESIYLVSFHFTPICDLNCPFCYIEKTENTKNNKVILSIAEEIGTTAFQVSLGGGEPLHPKARDTLFDILEVLHKKSIVNITTNGKYVLDMDEQDLKFLRTHIASISVSFDLFKTQKVKTVETVNFLIKKGFIVYVNFLVLRSKDRDLLSYFPVLFDFLQSGVYGILFLYPKKPASVNLLPSFSEYLRFLWLFQHFLDPIDRQRMFVDNFTRLLIKYRKNRWGEPCSYAQTLISIDWNGNIYGCSFDHRPIGKYRELGDLQKTIRKIRRKQKKYLKYSCPFV